MKRGFIVFATVCFLLSSCSKEPKLVSEVPQGVSLTTKASSSLVNTAVSVQEAETTARVFAQGKTLESLIPVCDDGMTMVYAANYDKGWALISGDKRLQTILAYNDTGSFNPDSIANPGVAVWFDVVKNDMRAIVSQQETADKNKPEDSLRVWPQWWWVRELVSENIISQTTTGVDHLMSTIWGQKDPWNYKCPIYSTSPLLRCPTGCVAVAMSQILYYYHFFRGTPSGSYLTVGLTNPYQFGNNGTFYRTYYTDPSIAWQLMAKHKNTIYTEDVGDLMLDVGNRVNMYYGDQNSIATPSTAAFGYYGLACDSTSYNPSIVKTSLDNEVPVMIMAYPPAGVMGHAWVIDGYHETVTIQDNYYVWHRIYALIPDPEYDLSYPESVIFNYYPDMYEGKTEVIRMTYTPEQYFLMNWGYDDTEDQVAYNNGHYAMPEAATWTVGSNSYNTNKWIIYGFH